MSTSRISNKQKIFINEYVKSWNATKAAIAAGYSAKTATSKASQLLTKVNIKEEIAKRIKDVCMSGDEALKLLSEQARGSLDDCFDIEMVKSQRTPGEFIPNYRLNLVKAKEKGKLHLIKSIMPTANGTRVELYSSQRALEIIAKASGLFDEKIELEVKKPIKIKHIFTHEKKEEEEDE